MLRGMMIIELVKEIRELLAGQEHFMVHGNKIVIHGGNTYARAKFFMDMFEGVAWVPRYDKKLRWFEYEGKLDDIGIQIYAVEEPPEGWTPVTEEDGSVIDWEAPKSCEECEHEDCPLEENPCYTCKGESK